MPTMWTRLRAHKETAAPTPAGRPQQDVDLQQDLGNPRAGSPYGYSFTIKGGPAPARPPDLRGLEQQHPSERQL